MATVWVLGSLNVDAIVRVARHPAPGETVLGGPVELRFGGKGANQAVAAAVAGARVRMIGRVGEDADGRAYRDRLASFGIDVDAVRTDPSAATGRAAIAVDARRGEHDHRVAGRQRGGEPGGPRGPRGPRRGDVLLVQLEIDLEVVAEAVRAAAQRGRPGGAQRGAVRAAARGRARARGPGRGERGGGGRARRIRGGARCSCSSPAARRAPPGATSRCAAERVEQPVDTTGAGDTYCGALAAALAAGAGPADAMRAAAAAAARSVTWLGAQPDPAV